MGRGEKDLLSMKILDSTNAETQGARAEIDQQPAAKTGTTKIRQDLRSMNWFETGD